MKFGFEQPANADERTPRIIDGAFLVDTEKIVSKKIEQFKEMPIVKKAFEMLDNLPENLLYHAKQHTDDVLHEAILFGTIDGLDEKELEKTAIAAAWHDVGYLIKKSANESEAVRLFNEEADASPYAEEIGKMIMDTQVLVENGTPRIAMNHPSSAHLLDADTSNFGRTDFKEKSALLAVENNIDMNDKAARLSFLGFALQLLENHEWHTPAARELRQEQKLRNIEALRREVEELKTAA